MVKFDNSKFNCFPKSSPFARQRPSFSDCGGALRYLPSNHIIGSFHTGGDDNQFKLPITKAYETCSVTVELPNLGIEETGTWLGVGAAAMQLNMVCVNNKYIGGWTTAGNHERIRITLDYAKALEVEANVTTSGEIF